MASVGTEGEGKKTEELKYTMPNCGGILVLDSIHSSSWVTEYLQNAPSELTDPLFSIQIRTFLLLVLALLKKHGQGNLCITGFYKYISYILRMLKAFPCTTICANRMLNEIMQLLLVLILSTELTQQSHNEDFAVIQRTESQYPECLLFLVTGIYQEYTVPIYL